MIKSKGFLVGFYFGIFQYFENRHALQYAKKNAEIEMTKLFNFFFFLEISIFLFFTIYLILEY
jgi:hypothetical protein